MLVRDAGFQLFDYTHIYDGLEGGDVALKEGWHHTNPRGHSMIADRLYDSLINDPAVVRAAREDAGTNTTASN